MTVAGSLGGGSKKGGGDESCVAPNPSIQRNHHGAVEWRTAGLPSSSHRPPGVSSSCRRRHLFLAAGAGGDMLVTAPVMPAAAATSFLAVAQVCSVAATFAAARGAADVVGSVTVAALQYVITTAA
jgi:hypothetical protein